MKILNDVLYWISNGMLVPSILLLLLGFGAALMLLGNVYAHWTERLRSKPAWQTLLAEVRIRSAADCDYSHVCSYRDRMADCVDKLVFVDWHPVHGGKAVSDYELGCQKELERCQLLIRVGPMLGLMGTLVPMGPALVALAAGDMATMAVNMQVAFSTTIVGIFVGGVGFFAQLVKKRWFNSDVTTLHYLLDLANAGVESESKTNPIQS
jgi:biopolymer transport protein ExbB/TolQ